ncbi:MAG: PAC2 family protein [Geodermatophilaceae bacterium]
MTRVAPVAGAVVLLLIFVRAAPPPLTPCHRLGMDRRPPSVDADSWVLCARGRKGAAVLDPTDLYELDADLPELTKPVLVVALPGFVDAGAAGRLLGRQLMDRLPHRPIATFDADQLIDHRSHRPIMTFVEDHWESYTPHVLAVHLVRDEASEPFLFLTGPEPDYQWERFTAAMLGLIERFDVRLTVGINAIPMAVPHTRPTGLTAHATRPELIAGYEPWLATVQVPGSVGALMEFRLGEAGQEAMGFAVHVPHYLAQAEYPDAADVLLDAIARADGTSSCPVPSCAPQPRRPAGRSTSR